VVIALFHKLDSLQTRFRVEAQQWRHSLVAQIQAQTALRHNNFASRLESVEKIERAADGFEQRLNHIKDRENSIQVLRNRLEEQTAHLSAANDQAAVPTSLSSGYPLPPGN
jgi:hypothetical protein